jgi:Uncharacterized protein conserved in bacteria
MVRRKARAKAGVVYLDTHIVLWLHDALVERLSLTAAAAINDNALRCSQFVLLELQFLYEIRRIRTAPSVIVASLKQSIGLTLSEVLLEDIMSAAMTLDWTRDVFDRMLAAEALITGYGLVTKDQHIRSHLALSIW